MAWYLSLCAGLVILLFVCSRLYVGYTNLERSIALRRDYGMRIPPDEISTVRLRKNGFRLFMIIALSLIATGAIGLYLKNNQNQSAVSAVDTPSLTSIPVPSDLGARYWLISKGKSGVLNTITTKRAGSSGTSYAHRAFNCSDQTFMYLGEGSTFEELKRSKPDSKMSPVVSGSISYHVGLEACK